MQITICGKRWELKFLKRVDPANSLGLCEHPREYRKAICIKAGLEPREELDVLLHELTHAGAFDLLDEGYVDQWATDAAKILWRLGWRKTDG